MLCERFGISRSPLREAYQVLAAEGLLDLLRNRGAVVSMPSLSEVLDNHTLLVTLECLGIELACDAATDDELAAIKGLHDSESDAATMGDGASAYSLNDDLHRAIVVASHNRPLIDAHLIVARQMIRVQNATRSLQPNFPAHEHDAFIEPLLGRAKRPAAAAMRRHLTTVEANLRQRLRILGEERNGDNVTSR